MRYAENVKVMNETFAMAAAQANAQELASLPLEVTVTLSLACNYRCSMCYQDRFDQTLPWETVERLIPVLPFARTLQLFGGEPLLYRHIQDFYRLAHQNGCRITMISNGSLLSEDMVESLVQNQVHSIKFSLDAASGATYRKIRGGDFQNVLLGIARLNRRKRELRSPFPIYDFNFLAMRSNIKELSRLVVIAAELGARGVNVFYPSMHKEALLDECVYFDQQRSDEMLARAREVAKRLGVALNLPPLFSETRTDQPALGTAHSACQDPWTKLLVNPDGSAHLCCAGDAALGNLNDEEFEALWNGPRARALRKTVNTPKEPAFCKRCRIREASPHNPELHMPRDLALKRGLVPAAAPGHVGTAA